MLETASLATEDGRHQEHDGGETWTAARVADGEHLTNSIYTGSEHVVYAPTRAFRSPDGLTWTESASDTDVVLTDEQRWVLAHSPFLQPGPN